MWWGCHGVPTVRVSASTGPVSSMRISTPAHAKVTGMLRSTTSSTTQPIWETRIEVAKIMAAGRRTGSCLPARSHWKIIGTRITTYPRTITRLSSTSPSSSEANMSGRPSARISTPTICTIVVSR